MKKNYTFKHIAFLIVAFLLSYSLFGQTLSVVDNNVNSNIITNLHGFCTGPNFTYDVYWNDTAGPAVVEVVNTSGTVLASGTTSPIRDILFNNSTTATLDIQVREQDNITNISPVVTVTRKDCVAGEIVQTDFITTGGLNTDINAPFVVPAGVTHIRASVIGGGGNGGRRPNTSRPATSGGGGGASAISTFAVTAGESFDVTVANARGGGNGPGRNGPSIITNNAGSTVSAQSGDGAGQGENVVAGDRGNASASIGQQTFDGGVGGTRSGNTRGNGGGAAHLTGSGTNGSSNSAGTSTLPGGNGGNNNGVAGSTAGGGGAGRNNGTGATGANGGNGARGLARIETFNSDIIAPTVTVEQASSQSDPDVVGNTITFTATFNEPIIVSSLDCKYYRSSA